MFRPHRHPWSFRVTGEVYSGHFSITVRRLTCKKCSTTRDEALRGDRRRLDRTMDTTPSLVEFDSTEFFPPEDETKDDQP